MLTAECSDSGTTRGRLALSLEIPPSSVRHGGFPLGWGCAVTSRCACVCVCVLLARSGINNLWAWPCGGHGARSCGAKEVLCLRMAAFGCCSAAAAMLPLGSFVLHLCYICARAGGLARAQVVRGTVLPRLCSAAGPSTRSRRYHHSPCRAWSSSHGTAWAQAPSLEGFEPHRSRSLWR